jgi:hypothetical protein
MPGPSGRRLHRVEEEVHGRGPEARPVAPGPGDAGPALDEDRDAEVIGLAAEDPRPVGGDGGEVQALEAHLRLAGVEEEVLDGALEAAHLVEDDAEVLLLPLPRPLLEELQGDAHGRQGIADLVGDAGGELAEDREAFPREACLLRGAERVVHRVEAPGEVPGLGRAARLVGAAHGAGGVGQGPERAGEPLAEDEARDRRGEEPRRRRQEDREGRLPPRPLHRRRGEEEDEGRPAPVPAEGEVALAAGPDLRPVGRGRGRGEGLPGGARGEGGGRGEGAAREDEVESGDLGEAGPDGGGVEGGVEEEAGIPGDGGGRPLHAADHLGALGGAGRADREEVHGQERRRGREDDRPRDAAAEAGSHR